MTTDTHSTLCALAARAATMSLSCTSSWPTRARSDSSCPRSDLSEAAAAAATIAQEGPVPWTKACTRTAFSRCCSRATPGGEEACPRLEALGRRVVRKLEHALQPVDRERGSGALAVVDAVEERQPLAVAVRQRREHERTARTLSDNGGGEPLSSTASVRPRPRKPRCAMAARQVPG